MAAKHHSRSRPDAVEYANGVWKTEDIFDDVYTGDAESLIAAGLARRDEFPGQPGRGKMMVTYDAAGNPVPQGTNYRHGNPSRVRSGRRQITRRGKTFRVGIAVDEDTGTARQEAYLAAARLRDSNVVQIFGNNVGPAGQPSVAAPAAAFQPPPIVARPGKARRPRKALSRQASDGRTSGHAVRRTAACLADAGAVLRVLAVSVEAALDHKACERLQGAARAALQLLLDALELVDEHAEDNYVSRMTIYDAAGVVDAIQGACFEAMTVNDIDPGTVLAAADVAACARLAARLAGKAVELLAASSAPA